MDKPILIALICASLILVTPFTGVALENTVYNNLPEQPDDVEGLVAQIRTVIDEILQRYGHIPMVNNLANEILNLLGLIGKTIFCIFLVIITIPALLIFTFFFANFDITLQNIGGLLLILLIILDRQCPQPTSLNNLLPSFQSIYTMLKTTDNTNTFHGCPCLQE